MLLFSNCSIVLHKNNCKPTLPTLICIKYIHMCISCKYPCVYHTYIDKSPREKRDQKYFFLLFPPPEPSYFNLEKQYSDHLFPDLWPLALCVSYANKIHIFFNDVVIYYSNKMYSCATSLLPKQKKEKKLELLILIWNGRMVMPQVLCDVSHKRDPVAPRKLRGVLPPTLSLSGACTLWGDLDRANLSQLCLISSCHSALGQEEAVGLPAAPATGGLPN